MGLRTYRDDIALDFATRFVEYDPRTGWFRNKRTGYRMCDLDGAGYVQLCFGNKTCKAHRIAWLIVHGKTPLGDIDHINRVKWDNRMENLRVATPSQNTARRLSPRSKYGRGVTKHTDPKRKKPWGAYITVNWKRRTIGWFATQQEAADAYRNAHDAAFGEFSYFADAP